MTTKKSLLTDARRLSAVLPPLLLATGQVASAIRQGTHGRRRAGQGDGFWQFRQYVAGDPIHRIDWRQSARTDKLFVREREWETVQSMYLWPDVSASMQYSSHGELTTKADRARLLMLALADLLLRGGEKVIWLSDRAVSLYDKAGFERIAEDFSHNSKGESKPPPTRLVKSAQMVLASDFLMPAGQLDKMMQEYGAFSLKGVLLHIFDPAEIDLPFTGRLEIQGCENEAALLLPNAAALREAYREKREAHEKRIEQSARAVGWHYLRHTTDSPPSLTLLQLYEHLSADAYPFAQPSAQRPMTGQSV